jgi:hypothetical protein
MAGHLLGVLEPSVVLQVNSNAGCTPGVTSEAPPGYEVTTGIGGSVADRCKHLLSIHLTSTCAVIGMNSLLPFVPRGAKARGMARHPSPRHPLFRQRWFADDIIITGISFRSCI